MVLQKSQQSSYRTSTSHEPAVSPNRNENYSYKIPAIPWKLNVLSTQLSDWLLLSQLKSVLFYFFKRKFFPVMNLVTFLPPLFLMRRESFINTLWFRQQGGSMSI